MDPATLPPIPREAFYAIYIWSLIWKGLALWRAAQMQQRNWFIILLVINTIGILEIIYLFFFCKNKMKLADLQFWKLFMQNSSATPSTKKKK